MHRKCTLHVKLTYLFQIALEEPRLKSPNSSSKRQRYFLLACLWKHKTAHLTLSYLKSDFPPMKFSFLLSVPGERKQYHGTNTPGGADPRTGRPKPMECIERTSITGAPLDALLSESVEVVELTGCRSITGDVDARHDPGGPVPAGQVFIHTPSPCILEFRVHKI